MEPSICLTMYSVSRHVRKILDYGTLLEICGKRDDVILEACMCTDLYYDMRSLAYAVRIFFLRKICWSRTALTRQHEQIQAYTNDKILTNVIFKT